MEVFNMVRELNLEEYSIIAIIGDDATFQEAVNGVLQREDKRKLPFAFIPNTPESDICWCLGIMSLDHALDFIVKGEAIPIDTTRVLLDADNESSLPTDPVERY